MALIRTGAVFSDEANRRLAAFKNDRLALTPDLILNKYLFHGDPCVLTAEGKGTIFDAFQKEWGMERDELVLVGSSVTGFSLKTTRRYQLFDFSHSDIDVAITDSMFFADIWGEVHRYIQENKDWYQRDQFEAYLLQGWLRPDKFPGSIGDQWFDFFKRIQRAGQSGGIKVRAAIWPSIYFLRAYQRRGVEACRQEGLV